MNARNLILHPLWGRAILYASLGLTVLFLLLELFWGGEAFLLAPVLTFQFALTFAVIQVLLRESSETKQALAREFGETRHTFSRELGGVQQILLRDLGEVKAALGPNGAIVRAIEGRRAR